MMISQFVHLTILYLDMHPCLASPIVSLKLLLIRYFYLTLMCLNLVSSLSILLKTLPFNSKFHHSIGRELIIIIFVCFKNLLLYGLIGIHKQPLRVFKYQVVRTFLGYLSLRLLFEDLCLLTNIIQLAFELYFFPTLSFHSFLLILLAFKEPLLLLFIPRVTLRPTSLPRSPSTCV